MNVPSISEIPDRRARLDAWWVGLKLWLVRLAAWFSSLWDFGDESTSELCSPPNHIYQAKGIYTVSLTVTGSGGSDTETKAGYIIVDRFKVFLPLVTK